MFVVQHGQNKLFAHVCRGGSIADDGGEIDHISFREHAHKISGLTFSGSESAWKDAEVLRTGGHHVTAFPDVPIDNKVS